MFSAVQYLRAFVQKQRIFANQSAIIWIAINKVCLSCNFPTKTDDSYPQN